MAAGLIDRAPERAAVRAFLAGLDAGPRGLVFEGVAGIGKTAVWRAALADARTGRRRVLSCVAAQAEARLPFTGLGDLLDGLPAELLGALPPPQREALEIALVLRESGSGRMPDPKAAGVALRSLLVLAAQDAPVVIAIDDLQWLDSETARALAFAVRRLSGHPVGVLATLRVPLTAPEPLGLARALDEQRLVRARLGPLGLETLHALLAQRLGHVYARPVLVRIAEASGGNPLFALEIGRMLGTAPTLEPGRPLPVPESLRELVDARVASVSLEARAALEVAAALSHPTAELVERATSPECLVAAEQSGLLEVHRGHVAFAHPLHAAAVYAAAASGTRRALHRRLAELVTDPEERVRHAALAAREPNEDVAVALEAGAAKARARGAWAAAGDLLEQARALTPRGGPEAALERGVRAAEHHIRAGDRGRARALLEELLAEAPAGRSRSDALRLLAEILYNEEGFATPGPLLESALEHAGDPLLAVAIELDLCYVHANHMADYRGAGPHAERALAIAERAGDRSALAEALATRVMVRFLMGHGVDWDSLARAQGLEDRDVPLPLHLRPSGIAPCLALWTGRFEQARAQLTALRLAAIESGDESDLAYFLSWLTWLETLTGNFALAARYAEDAVVCAALSGSEFNRAWALAHRAVIHAHRGDVAAVRADAAAATEICVRFEASNPMLWISGALALAALSEGDLAAAWAAAGPLVEKVEAAPEIGEVAGLWSVPYAIEALIGLGELERAERLLDRVERKARELGRTWAVPAYARVRGLLLAERGDIDGALQALESAVSEQEPVGMPFGLARTLLMWGAIRRRARQKRLARDALERALELFEGVGAYGWAERARDELGRVGRRRCAPGELTPAERRVVGLAAEGKSNKQIAAALFVSVHTVEVHLTHAYAKLGVRSRTQLGARLARAET